MRMERRSHGVLLRAGLWLIVIGAALVALDAGMRLRRWAWHATGPDTTSRDAVLRRGAHFRGDIGNIFIWGPLVENVTLFRVYEGMVHQGQHEPDYQGKVLDYPPLRLAVASAYYQWTRRNYDDVTGWRDDYAFTRPMLRANLSAEIASAVLVFLIIRLWRVRTYGPGLMRGVVAGFFGAMLFWFNPAIIWVSHCWPQWDVWFIPFFLAAVLLASLDWWFAAGVAVMIGSALKGQILLGAPVLLLWPLFQLNFGAILRFACGFGFCAAVIVLPWMLLDRAAFAWHLLALGGLLLLVPIVLKWKPHWIVLTLFAVVALLLTIPWTSDASPAWKAASLTPLAVFALVRFLPRGFVLPVGALCIAGIVMLAIPLFNASSAWYTIGYRAGTEKFDDMMMGRGVYNVPAILVRNFGWASNPLATIEMPWRGSNPADSAAAPKRAEVTVTQFMRGIYAVTLVLCGIGAAIQARRRDARFLVAMAAPWLLFYLLLTQMHGRYCIWAAGISALLAGVSTGLALLGVLVSVVAAMGAAHNQLLFVREWAPQTLQFMQRADPGVGWMLVLTALIFLYVALTPRRNPSLQPGL